HQEAAQALEGFLRILYRAGSRKYDEEVCVVHAGGPDFLTADHPLVTLFARLGGDLGRIGPGSRLSYREGLQAYLAGGDQRQDLLFLLFRTMAGKNTHHEHLAMEVGAAAAHAVDFF